jgi:hypothetical protein
MNIRSLFLSGGLAILFATTSVAGIIGSTYDFSTSTTGATAIGATDGTYTDPANPGFCVGPPVGCDVGSGMSGSFSFADITPTTSTLTFIFFGSTDGAGPGTFAITLGNFALLGGGVITNVAYNSGNLFQGDFSSVAWNGTDALFTGSTGGDYDAVGGATVVFDVTLASTAIPEPSSIWLVGPILGGLLVSLKKRRKAS